MNNGVKYNGAVEGCNGGGTHDGANGHEDEYSEEYRKEMKKRRKEKISLEAAAELLYEDVLMGFVTQVAFVHHRAYTLDLVVEPPTDEQNGFDPTQPSTSNGIGRSNGSRNKYECACPECGRTIAATRFAPHLENCLGMGRNASRAARRKAAGFYAAGNNFGSKSDTNLVAKVLQNGEVTHSATNSIVDDGSDNDPMDAVDDDDDDWKGKKTRKRKPAAKRGGKGGGKRKR